MLTTLPPTKWYDRCMPEDKKKGIDKVTDNVIDKVDRK